MRRLLLMALLLWTTPGLAQKTREQKVREDRQRVEAEGFWRYNDLPGAMAAAGKSGKPVLVVLRCLPCEECVKLDDELVDQDPVIRPLLEQFECVRVVATNGLDLRTFQFDTDQSFAVFMLNADGTVYGRFGTRSHRTEWLGDVSLAGLAKALSGALALHRDFPKQRDALAGKQGPEPDFVAPEKYPALQSYGARLNYEGDVVRSCIHCHQIGDAQREFYRERDQTIPDSVLFPFAHPRVIGLTLDPKEAARVLTVEAGSPAEKAGLQPGDDLLTLGLQPLISIADLQWVLHQTPAQGGELAAEVRRDGLTTTISLQLEPGWKRRGDISWRVTSWGLRRMVTGGLLLEELTDEERTAAKIPEGGMALRVKHAGEYGAHAAARQAGVEQGDVLTSYDGRSDLMRDTDVLAHGITAHRPGDFVSITVLRDGRPLQFRLPIQE